MENHVLYPPVYVMSKFNMIEALKEHLPAETEIRSVNTCEFWRKNLQLTDDDLDYVRDCELVISDCYVLTENFYKMPKLKWIHCTSVGTDPILRAIREKEFMPSFLLTHHGGVKCVDTMAEFVLSQIVNYERNIMHAWKNQLLKIWTGRDEFYNSRTLNNLTVGILGVGNMGSGICRILKSRGTKVMGFSRHQKGNFSEGTSVFDRIFTDLSEILPKCDYICNTLPGTPLTHGLMNGSLLEICTKKPVFINVGRGDIISQECLIHALNKKWLSGAILDVIDIEPLPPSSKLWDMPNVIITPHIACVPVAENVAEEFAKNYRRYMKDDKLQHIVNWSKGY